jgi:multidrug efflux system outer membrane protein
VTRGPAWPLSSPLSFWADARCTSNNEHTLGRRAGWRIIRLDFPKGADCVGAAEKSSLTPVILQLQRQHAQAVNLLTLLVGTPLNNVSLPLPVLLSEQRLPTALTPGLPAETLTARPDVRSAEQQLIAANADIGAARAAFFPRISLTTTLGLVSSDLDDLFGNGTGVWTFAPRLVQPIFAAGRNRGNLQATRATREIAIAQYERAIQSAFREVADALVARDALADELAAQERLVEAERARTGLTEQLYRAGASAFPDFLDAQRQFLAAEQALLQTRLTQATAAVDLYIALGGGLR